MAQAQTQFTTPINKFTRFIPSTPQKEIAQRQNDQLKSARKLNFDIIPQSQELNQNYPIILKKSGYQYPHVVQNPLEQSNKRSLRLTEFQRNIITPNTPYLCNGVSTPSTGCSTVVNAQKEIEITKFEIDEYETKNGRQIFSNIHQNFLLQALNEAEEVYEQSPDKAMLKQEKLKFFHHQNIENKE